MPNVDIVCLPDRDFQREKLVRSLTEVFCAKAACAPEQVHLRFHEIEEDNYFVGGPVAAGKAKPVARSPYPERKAVYEINVAWYAGRSAETQEAVAAGLTEAVSGVLKIPAGNVEVNFSILAPENHFEGSKRAPAPKV